MMYRCIAILCLVFSFAAVQAEPLRITITDGVIEPLPLQHLNLLPKRLPRKSLLKL